MRYVVRIDGFGQPWYGQLAEVFCMFAEYVEGGEEAFGGGRVEGCGPALMVSL